MTLPTKTDLTVANTILEQLGGNRFRAMTGAKHFLGAADYLAFALPGGRKVKVTLTQMDDYLVEVLTRTGKPVAYREGVYCDTLQKTFTALTGLETRL